MTTGRGQADLSSYQSGSNATYAEEGIDTGYTVPQEKTLGISYPLDLAIEDLGLGEVQEIDVNFPHVSPCPATLQQQLIAGVAQPYELRVFGTLSSPWTQQTKMLWGLWQGPHANLTFPMVGDISSPDGGVPTPFTINSSPEKWTQPAQENVVVSLGIPPDWSMDSAIPAPSTANTPLWSGHGGISPAAQFSVPSQLAMLQDWIVIFAVGLGIGGGFLASMLFEFLRPLAEEHDGQSTDAAGAAQEQPPIPSPDVKPHVPRRARVRLPLIGAAFLLGCLLGRMHRRGTA
jgi:hypothetical protein